MRNTLIASLVAAAAAALAVVATATGAGSAGAAPGAIPGCAVGSLNLVDDANKRIRIRERRPQRLHRPKRQPGIRRNHLTDHARILRVDSDATF